MSKLPYFAREAAASLLKLAKATKDPTAAAGLIQRAADLKDRADDLSELDAHVIEDGPQAARWTN